MHRFFNQAFRRVKSLPTYLPILFPRYYRGLLRTEIISSQAVCLIVGSGGDKIDNWISSDFPVFNVKDHSHWEFLFSKQPWSKILAEHVFEHLYLEDFSNILKIAKSHATRGAVLRVAVPDGFSTIDGYIEAVKPGGTGAGAFDHKVLYDYLIMKKLAENSKLECDFVEFFDENGIFNSNYSDINGPIKRSKQNDPRNSNGLSYTSLIVDFYF